MSNYSNGGGQGGYSVSFRPSPEAVGLVVRQDHRMYVGASLELGGLPPRYASSVYSGDVSADTFFKPDLTASMDGTRMRPNSYYFAGGVVVCSLVSVRNTSSTIRAGARIEEIDPQRAEAMYQAALARRGTTPSVRQEQAMNQRMEDLAMLLASFRKRAA